MKSKKRMLEFKKKHGKLVIPAGLYCEECPYLDINKKKPKHFNGYCWYLERGDWDFDGEAEVIEVNTRKVYKKKDLGFSFSMLWDAIKECNINKVKPNEKLVTMTLPNYKKVKNER